MKKTLLILFLLVLSASLFAQEVDIQISVTDGVDTQVLNFGLDPTATDGIDAALGEQEQPPVPPSGIFDARFVGTNIGLGAQLGQGLLKDYRQGDGNLIGDRVHEISFQIGTGSGITINYDFPENVSAVLQDVITGTIINEAISGTGSYVLSLPALTSLKMTVTYDLGLTIGWCNLQWPPTANINAGGSFTAYAQIYVDGLTNAPGAGAGIDAWIGYSDQNTDPSTWTNWVPAVYNVDVGNNDEYMASVGSTLPEGTYYYASRFSLNSGAFVYGGYSTDGGGFWNGTTYTSGELTVTTPYTVLWERSAATTTLPAWFSTSSTERGMAVGNGHAYVVSRNGGTNVKVLDLTDGSDVADLSVTGVSGGTFLLNDVETSSDGKIFACNLTTNSSTSPFRVYMWDTESADPVEIIALTTTTGYRFGDKFSAVGSVSDNSAAIYAYASGTDKYFKFTTADMGATWTPTELTVSNGASGTSAAIGAKITGTSEVYINSNGRNIVRHQADGTAIDTVSGGLVSTGSNAVRYLYYTGDGNEYLINFWYGTNKENSIVLDVTGGAANASYFALTPTLGANSNGNGTGDVDYARNDAGTYDIFVLSTNNGIGAYRINISAGQIGFANLQFPASATITEGDTLTAYGQVWADNLTSTAGQALGVYAWVGYSTDNTDPATWTNWMPAYYNTDVGNNDEYAAKFGSDLAPGTYYYAFRYVLENGMYVYGGTDGFWNGTNSVNGELTVSSSLAAPTSLTATVDPQVPKRVDLAWQDNSDNETGFYIERSLGVPEAFVKIDSVGADVQAYIDTNVEDETEYSYRVNAYNADGVSEYTNVATVTTPIPVELTSLSASVGNASVMIEWSTATETNNSGFNVERKTDGEWQSIAFVNGVGTTTEPQNYSFVDRFENRVYTGTVEYRLKQVDFDGTFDYSKVISVEVDFTPKEYTLEQNYPNPFNPTTKIKYTLPFESSVKIQIYNAIGQIVAEVVNQVQATGYYEVEWSAKNLSSGIYIYSMSAESVDGSDSFNSIKKMMLIK